MSGKDRNRAASAPEGSKGKGGAHEARRLSPKKADEQASPEPERLVTPQERAGQDIEELENPPQAEGPRDRV